MDRLPVLYDDDCGFCRAILGGLLALDRGRRLRPVALQSDEAARLLPQTTLEERLAAVHVAPSGGEPVSGGEALAAILHEIPVLGPAGTALGRLPGPADRGYRLVADNRTQLSKLVPAAVKRRADRLVAARS